MAHPIPVSVPHFQEHDRFNPVTSSDRMPAEVYGAALDYLVIGCVDLVFTCQSQVLLAKRNRPPRANWWLIGGRMTAGEEPVQAAVRKAAEEANLKLLSPDRFQLIGVYSTCFASRSQPPQHHGLHSLNITYKIELSEFEKNRIDLDPSEYVTWEWVELEQVGNRLESRDPMDEALLQVLKSLA